MSALDGALVGAEAPFTPEDVAAICADVWACFLGAEAESLVPLDGEVPLEGAGYVATIGITGEWNGHVILRLPEAAALRAARDMLGVADVTPAEVGDAVGELVNIVGGNLKGLVPPPSSLGLPIVVAGQVAPSLGRTVAWSCASAFLWLSDPVRVDVWQSTQSVRSLADGPEGVSSP